MRLGTVKRRLPSNDKDKPRPPLSGASESLPLLWLLGYHSNTVVWACHVRRHVTHQETSLTKFSLRAMPAPASKMEERVSPLKSVDTT